MTDRPRDLRGDAAGVAHYIASLSADLASLARANGLNTLGYLLEMARLEAENVAGVARIAKTD
jgi:hypothetical protein